MASADRMRRWGARVVMAGLALSLSAVALRSQVQESDGPPPPQRFERVLWCSDGVAGPVLARAGGYTAVQLGRGGDAGVLRSLGLRFYIDQPIGKGLLELRDAEWKPLVRAFEASRDATAAIRPTCWSRPGAVDAAAEAAAAEVRRVGRDGVLFVALADEASATRHAAPFDSCRCEHCLAGFREFLRQRFAEDLGRINGALGTHYPALDLVHPLSTDQVRARELGDRRLPRDLRAWSLWLEYVDRGYAGMVRAIRQRIAAVLADVPIGLTGTSAPAAYGGTDPFHLLRGHSLAEPYAVGGAPELERGLLAPGTHFYATLTPPSEDALDGVAIADYVRARLAELACHGYAGVVVWNDRTVVAAEGEARSADRARSPFGAAVSRGFDELGDALDALAGAEVEFADVWLVESQASVRAWWMLDSAADGLTWVRRLASYEASHSTSQAARRSWLRLLQDLGLQPRFVSDQGLAERLLIERPRCVVLPATLALSDRTARALRVYVENGGTLLADHSPALYDEQLLRRERGALDELFGVEARSLDWHDLLVREGRATARAGNGLLPIAEAGLRGPAGVAGDGPDASFERPVGRGRVHYLNAPVVAYDGWRLEPTLVVPARELRRRVRRAMERARVLPPCLVAGEGLPTCIERVPLRLRDGRRVLAVRVHALDRPQVLAAIAERGLATVTLTWPTARRVRNLAGVELGDGTSCELQLDPFGARFVEVGR